MSKAFACTKYEIKKANAEAGQINHIIHQVEYNPVFLKEQDMQLKKIHKKIELCFETSIAEIKKLETLRNNITRINPDNVFIKVYNTKIARILEKQQLSYTTLNQIESVLLNIKKQINKSDNLIRQKHKIRSLSELIRDYNPADDKFVLKPLGNIVPFLSKDIDHEDLLFYIVLISSIGGLALGFFLMIKINNVIKSSHNALQKMYFSYLNWTLPFIMCLIPIDLIVNYSTKDWLILPPFLDFCDFLFRIFTLYILSLTAICFIINVKGDKEKLIRLLNQTSLFLFLSSLIQESYINFFEQTNFSIILYLLIYTPFYYIGLLIFGFKWSKTGNLISNQVTRLLFKIFVLGTVIGHAFFQIKNINNGYLDFTTIAFLLLCVISFYYYKFLSFQLNFKACLTEQQLARFDKITHGLFGIQHQSFYELIILTITLNFYLFICFIYTAFNLLYIPEEVQYHFYQAIFYPISIDNIQFTLIKISYGLTFFSVVMLIERYFSNYLELKNREMKNIKIFLTKRNFMHYIFLLMVLTLSLLIIGIPSTTLIVIFGGVSLGAGFGLQFIVENLASGLLIILKSEFLVGDHVNILNISTGSVILDGTVKHIHSIETTIQDTNGTIVIIPNSLMLKNGLRKFPTVSATSKNKKIDT